MNDEQSKLVPFARTWRKSDPARTAEFVATARRLRFERESSADLIARVLRETPRLRWSTLAARPDLQTAGALDQFSKEIDRRLDHDPREALSIAELATNIAEAIADDAYPRVTLAQLRSHAWKDRGQALCYLSRYDDALCALERAEAAVSPYGALAHDQAIVWFVRATVLQHLRRFEEAQALLDECAEVFGAHGDQTLYGKAALSRGLLQIRRGDHASAKETLTPLIDTLDASSNGLARLALGWAHVYTGTPGDALVHFTIAAQTFDRVGQVIQSLRAAWGIGAVLLRQGRLAAAIDQLSTVRAMFLTHQMTEEAGLTGLEIVEAELLRAQSEEAKALAATIVHEFVEARMNHRAIAALGHLSGAVHEHAATPEVVRSVHDYIVALRDDPTCEYSMPN